MGREYVITEFHEREEQWLVVDADGEHSAEDAPVDLPDDVAPMSQEEAKSFTDNFASNPIAGFAHRENHALCLFIWPTEEGAVILVDCDNGNSMPYWVSKSKLRRVFLHIFDDSDWHLANARAEAKDALIGVLVGM